MTDMLNTFNFEGRAPVRVIFVNGEPRWVAKDIAEALGCTWAGSASISHVPNEWRGVNSVQTPRGTQEMATFTEQGLYFFLGRSDKKTALPFQMWIAGEVLPSIRRTGSYDLQIPKTLPEALRAYADTLEANKALACEVKVLTPKAEFHDRVADADSGQSIGEVAKVLGTGQNRLFAWLRAKKILMSGNHPYQEHLDAGRFKVIDQNPWKDSEGNLHIPTKTLITGKGVIWLQKLWDEDHRQ
jgi:phage antirepressor YoqD-like protein